MFSLNMRRVMARSLGFSLCSLAGTAAQAATIKVNEHGRGIGWSGGCTLPEAILAANTNAKQYECPEGSVDGTDTILLPEGVALNMSDAPAMTISSNIEIKTNKGSRIPTPRTSFSSRRHSD